MHAIKVNYVQIMHQRVPIMHKLCNNIKIYLIVFKNWNTSYLISLMNQLMINSDNHYPEENYTSQFLKRT